MIRLRFLENKSIVGGGNPLFMIGGRRAAFPFINSYNFYKKYTWRKYRGTAVAEGILCTLIR